MPLSKIELFCSYSHKDQSLREEFESHIAILKRTKSVEIWTDRKIGAGDEWAGQIDSHLETANVIALLISSDFINSDFCYGTEMTRAMERHTAKQAQVVPVIVRPCRWQDAPFGALQALPPDGKPVTVWPNRDEAWTAVAVGLNTAVVKVLSEIKAAVEAARSCPPRRRGSGWMAARLRASILKSLRTMRRNGRSASASLWIYKQKFSR